jgi:predicted nucleic acid-binding protein
MRVFVDANIIVDVLLQREPFVEHSSAVLSICQKNKAALAPHTISNIFFVMRKEYSTAERKLLLLGILDYIDIVPTGKYQIVSALKNSEIDDFEDALQLECALEFNADCIVTRDAKGFTGSTIEIILPEDFVARFGEQGKDAAPGLAPSG